MNAAPRTAWIHHWLVLLSASTGVLLSGCQSSSVLVAPKPVASPSETPGAVSQTPPGPVAADPLPPLNSDEVAPPAKVCSSLEVPFEFGVSRGQNVAFRDLPYGAYEETSIELYFSDSLRRLSYRSDRSSAQPTAEWSCRPQTGDGGTTRVRSFLSLDSFEKNDASFRFQPILYVLQNVNADFRMGRVSPSTRRSTAMTLDRFLAQNGLEARFYQHSETEFEIQLRSETDEDLQLIRIGMTRSPPAFDREQ